MINKLANVHPGAKIADKVEISSFATIYEDVEIGTGCWIGPNVVIMNGARIGKKCEDLSRGGDLRRSAGSEIPG